MVILMALLGLAGAATEHIAPPAGPDFVLGFEAHGPAPIQEFVPRGETVERWTRMVTLLQLGWKPGVGPRRFAGFWAESIQRGCPGAVIGAIRDTPLAGHESVTVQADCPLNRESGGPETVIARFVTGGEQLHNVQAAIRGVATPNAIAWARTVVDTATLCASNDSRPACRTD
ncbi:hypothetical protein RN629_08515 [Sphingomonadaceae bacterium jetA1]|uniref:hypothetical protein n=1 Tax=Facivitalis istanbulensis TaxID=3075838 RepID=UPI0034716FD9